VIAAKESGGFNTPLGGSMPWGGKHCTIFRNPSRKGKREEGRMVQRIQDQGNCLVFRAVRRGGGGGRRREPAATAIPAEREKKEGKEGKDSG